MGGFMGSKAIEADAGFHTLAMAVAVSHLLRYHREISTQSRGRVLWPVTSWRLYGEALCTLLALSSTG